MAPGQGSGRVPGVAVPLRRCFCSSFPFAGHRAAEVSNICVCPFLRLPLFSFGFKGKAKRTVHNLKGSSDKTQPFAAHPGLALRAPACGERAPGVPGRARGRAAGGQRHEERAQPRRLRRGLAPGLQAPPHPGGRDWSVWTLQNCPSEKGGFAQASHFPTSLVSLDPQNCINKLGFTQVSEPVPCLG